jgi:outer membrane protein assembly factor BamB
MPKSMEFVRPGVFIPKKESAPPPKVGPKRDLEAEIIMPPQPKDRKQVNAIDGVYKFNTDSIVKEQNGKEIWRARVDEGPFHQLVVVSADSRVVYVSGTKVVALDTATGKLMWTSPIPQLAETKEAAAWISGSGVVSVSVNNQIIRYNTRDGSKK